MRSRLATAAVLAALTATVAGCNLITPQATTFEYDAADGISGRTGAVDIRNAVLVLGDEGTANLAVTFVLGDQPETGATTSTTPSTDLAVTVGGETQIVTLEPGVTTYGFPEQQLVFPLEADAGSLQDVVFQAEGVESTALPVQVFSTESAGYEELAPVPAPEEESDPQPSVIDELEPVLSPAPSP